MFTLHSNGEAAGNQSTKHVTTIPHSNGNPQDKIFVLSLSYKYFIDKLNPINNFPLHCRIVLQ